MELTARQLNRATLARQLLLERHALPVPRAVERLCAMQAQWPDSPYVGLWSRARGFDREELTRARERKQVVRGTLMRVTIHLLSARDYLVLAPLWHGRGGGELLHLPPAGTWRFFGKKEVADAQRWLGKPFGDRDAGARLLVRRYLGGYGPASRRDLLRFSGLRVGDVQPALEALRLRELRADDGRTLLDLPRAPLPAADVPAPVRFLGRWDNALLAYDRRARILPDAYAGESLGLVGEQTFLVDGFVAGLWKVERAKTSATLALTPLAPLPRVHRRDVEDEAQRLLAWHEPAADVRKLRWT